MGNFQRRRLGFREASAPEDPDEGNVVFYVNTSGELVKRLPDGSESVVGAAGDIAATVAAAIAAHEADADAHPDHLTTDS